MNNEEKIIELLTEIRDSLKKPKAVKRFVPPSISEVEQYLFDNKFKTVAEDFINFYESKNWMVGRNKMKDWKAAVRTWEKRNGSHKQTNKPSLAERATNARREFEQQDNDKPMGEAYPHLRS